MTELMDFVQQTPRYHFDFKTITKAKNTVLAIETIYLNDLENPQHPG